MKKAIISSFFLVLALSLCGCSYIPGIVDISLPDGEIQIERNVPQILPVSYTTEDQQLDFKTPTLHRLRPANVELEFDSADDSIATVDAGGNVLGVALGETEITVKASNSVNEKTATLKVLCYENQKDLSVIPEVLEVEMDEQIDLADLYSEYVRWNAVISSHNDDIVSIDGTVLKPVEPGEAAVFLTLGNESRRIVFQAIEKVSEYTLDHETLEGSAETTATLGMGEYLPENANRGLKLTYISSDKNIVTIDDDGTVYFVAPGEATITAVNDLGMKVECTVTVTEKKVVPPPEPPKSTNPDDYDWDDPAVAAVLSMVGEKHTCSMVAEAAANAKGESGYLGLWPFIGLGPENFLYLGVEVSSSEIQPGDIIYYPNGGLGFSHVSVYIGNGMAVHGNFDKNGITKIANAFYTTVTHIRHID